MKVALKRPVEYRLQRGGLDARPFWQRVLNGTPEAPVAGSNYMVFNFNVGVTWQMTHWLSFN